jgi:hypothetical protein
MIIKDTSATYIGIGARDWNTDQDLLFSMPVMANGVLDYTKEYVNENYVN